MQNSENLKYNLYRFKTLLLEKKYLKEAKNNDNIIFLLNKYVSNLKLIDDLYTSADIEFVVNKNTSYPDTLYKNEMINRYNFYATLLGYVDSKLYYNKSKVNKYFKRLIIEHCISSMKSTDSSIYKEIIYSKDIFGYICNIELNKNNIDLLNFIESYIKGYKNQNIILDSVYYEFITLTQNLDIYKKNNRNKFENFKLKKKVKL